VTERGSELAVEALAAVESADAAFFEPVASLDPLLVSLRSLARV
jgi:hypothetical protein